MMNDLIKIILLLRVRSGFCLLTSKHNSIVC